MITAMLFTGLLTTAGVRATNGTNDTLPTVTLLASWAGNLQGVWYLEEGEASTRVNSGSCGTSCNLARTNNTTNSSTFFMQGTASNFFDGTNDNLTCTNANCGSGLGVASTAGSGGSVTFGCWWRSTDYAVNATTNMTIMDRFTANTGYALDLSVFGGAASRCKIDATTASGGGFIVGLNAPWTHSICAFDDSANTLKVYNNGLNDGSATPSSITSNTERFTLGETAASTLDYDGYLDECFVYKGVLTDKDICRICSCGIDGANCSYYTGTTTWNNKGRNATMCGSCTLPTDPTAAMGAS